MSLTWPTKHSSRKAVKMEGVSRLCRFFQADANCDGKDTKNLQSLLGKNPYNQNKKELLCLNSTEIVI